MPGARLRPNFNAPADASFAIFAKGDGTYDSVAVAVQRQFLKQFSHLDHVGSNRRIWLHVTPSSGPTFLWLVFYLPANNEAAWKAEAEGILSDATTLLEQLSNPSGVSPGILLSGDANFQPFCICRVRDPKPQREATFQGVLSALNAVVVNPICEADDTVPLQLPLCNKMVHVRSCDTHHCCGGSGASRAIDLICTSSCLPAEVCIHNGVHCKGLSCTWDLCIEYTRGDHFLIETLLPIASVSFLTPATVSLPSHWREESLWEHGISRASRCLSSLTSVFQWALALNRPGSPSAHLSLDQWIVDVLGLSLQSLTDASKPNAPITGTLQALNMRTALRSRADFYVLPIKTAPGRLELWRRASGGSSPLLLSLRTSCSLRTDGYQLKIATRLGSSSCTCRGNGLSTMPLTITKFLSVLSIC